MPSKRPTIIRGITASQFNAEVSDEHPDIPAAGTGLRMLAMCDAAALPKNEADDMPSDLILLTGGGRSNFGLPPDPPQPDSHDFSGDWSGIVGRIVDASAEAEND
jgi:hypothetical protein